MVVGGVECNEIVRCGKPNARHCTERPDERELLYCHYWHYCHYYHYQHSRTLLHAANSNT